MAKQSKINSIRCYNLGHGWIASHFDAKTSKEVMVIVNKDTYEAFRLSHKSIETLRSILRSTNN